MKKIIAQGLTLIELIVTIAIVAIVATLGVPAFTDTMLSNRISVRTNELLMSLHLARSESVKRGVQVTLRRTGTYWENGWRVFTDLDGDGQYDSGDGDEELRVDSYTASAFSLRTDASFSNWLAYLPSAVATGNGGSIGTFRLCRSDSNTAKSRSVTINRTGRISKTVGTTTCP